MEETVVASTILLGATFTVSCASKVRSGADFIEFMRSIPAFGIRRSWAKVIAILIVASEASIVLLLVASAVARTRAVGLAAAALLLSAVTIAVVNSVRSPQPAQCRCFGRRQTTLSRRHVIRNALLLASAVAGLAAERLADDMNPAAIVIGLLYGTIAASLMLRFDDLADLLARPTARR